MEASLRPTAADLLREEYLADFLWFLGIINGKFDRVKEEASIWLEDECINAGMVIISIFQMQTSSYQYERQQDLYHSSPKKEEPVTHIFSLPTDQSSQLKSQAEELRLLKKELE